MKLVYFLYRVYRLLIRHKVQMLELGFVNLVMGIILCIKMHIVLEFISLC